MRTYQDGSGSLAALEPFETIAADCPVSSAADETVADEFDSAEVFAVGCPILLDALETVAAECPVAFDSVEAFVADCPVLFDALDAAIVAESPLSVLYLLAARSSALLHHTFHHQSLTDCQRSEKMRPTAAAATNQSPW